MQRFQLFLIAICLFLISPLVSAVCKDSVVLVHGNTGNASDWQNTYDYFRSQGYSSNQLYRPEWGSKSCAACNNHSGSEETPVRQALQSALANSCTGKVDVIAHSMGVTLAAQQIIKLGAVSKVDAFVGVAGAYRGLWSCGTYPFNFATSTCGYWGLSVSSPFLDDLYGRKFASRVYLIKSYIDQVVCATGTCYVGGVHSSRIAGEKATYTYNYGHFGLQTYTYAKQYQLVQ